jgi:hypothetical protein
MSSIRTSFVKQILKDVKDKLAWLKACYYAPDYGPSYTGSTHALGACRLGSIPSGPKTY